MGILKVGYFHGADRLDIIPKDTFWFVDNPGTQEGWSILVEILQAMHINTSELDDFHERWDFVQVTFWNESMCLLQQDGYGEHFSFKQLLSKAIKCDTELFLEDIEDY